MQRYFETHHEPNQNASFSHVQHLPSFHYHTVLSHQKRKQAQKEEGVKSEKKETIQKCNSSNSGNENPLETDSVRKYTKEKKRRKKSTKSASQSINHSPSL